MLRQGNWSGRELRAFVAHLRKSDPELFAELKTKADRTIAEETLAPGLDPAAPKLNEIVMEGAAPGEDFTFESIILTSGRPVLSIRRDQVDTVTIDDPAADVIRTRLKNAQQHLDLAIPAVGRIEVQNNPLYEWVGTGWLVADGVIVTNRHVASAFGMRDGAKFKFRPGIDLSRPQSVRIDFLEELGRSDALEAQIDGIIWIEPETGPDVALLRLAGRAGERARPIPLAASLPDARTQVAVIGYPARDSRVPDSRLMDRLYGDAYNKKRLAPGQITQAAEASVAHDCTTLGGNSGSVVLDLESGKAVALHFSGIYMRSNFGVPAKVVESIVTRRPWQGADTRRGRTSPATHVQPDRIAAAAVAKPVAALKIEPVNGGVLLTVPITIDMRLAVAGADPDAGGLIVKDAGGDIDAAVEAVRAQLADRSDVVSVRPGYVFRDGWITKDRAVVIRLKPQSTAEAADLGLGKTALGFPVELRDADPAEELAQSLGLGDAEAPHRYVKNYERELRGEFALKETSVERILCHASPDAGWPTLSTFLDGLDSEFVLAMYDFSAPHIVRKVAQKLTGSRPRSKKSFTLVLDPKESLGEGTKANDIPEQEVIATFAEIEHLAFEHAFVPMKGPRRPFDSAYHIKVAVADGKSFWLSSGNWQSSNQPDVRPEFGPGQDAAPLKTFNREWHAIVESGALAKAFRAHIKQDRQDAADFPDTEALDLAPLPSVLVPAELLQVPDDELPARATYFAPFEARNVKVTPLLSPDNYADATLRFVNSARQQLLIQNQSFKPGKTDNDPKFKAILDAVLEKQRANLDVRIIFRKIGDVPDILERIADYGFDMERVRVQTNCHTKGIVVDGKAVLLGSHNWTTAGVVYNRDASLIVRDEGVAAYFTRLFEFDWTRTGKRRVATGRRGKELVEVRVVPPGAEALVPPGYVRLSWAEWTGE